MRELQAEIVRELNVSASINAAEEIRRRIDFLKSYLFFSKAKGLVLGISGGQDSTLAGRLCTLAVRELQEEGVDCTFIAVRLPYNVQTDEDDATFALGFIDAPEVVVFNIDDGVDGFVLDYFDATGKNISDFAKGNAKARLRMVAQYSLAGERNLLVVGTDHAAEAVTGFFTKFGDGGADITPLTGLSKRQGRILLQELSAPERLYLKIPTADLLDENPGQADESDLGLTYEQIDTFLEGGGIDESVAEKIEARYLMTRHKRVVPVTPFDSWWRA